MGEEQTSLRELGSVYRDVLDWGVSLPLWQQELIRRLVQGKHLGSQDIEQLANAAVAELEQQSSQYKALSLADFPAVLSAEPGRTLVAVKNLQNVNVLRSDQALTFGPALTVVYGDNGSGKSGYARVLKKVYRARVVDEILGDLSSDEPSLDSAAATFVLKKESVEESCLWKDSQSGGDFGRFAVLDSSCSANYIRGGSLDVGPAGIDVPRRFAENIDLVKKHLGARAAASRPSKEKLKGIPEHTSAGEFVGSLSGSTTEAEITKHTQWTETNDEQLASIRRDIAASTQQTLASRQKQANARLKAVESLGKRLKDWYGAVGDDAHHKLLTLLRTVEEAKDASKTIAGISHDEIPPNTLEGRAWPELIKAALTFVSSVGSASKDSGLAIGDDQCALCWQPLDSKAKDRLRKFITHLEGSAAQSQRQAERQLDTLRKALESSSIRLTPEDEALLIGESVNVVPITELLTTIVHRRDQFLALMDDASKKVDLAPLDDAPLASLRELYAKVQSELESLPKNDDEIQKQLKELRGKIDELTATKSLAGLAPELSEFVAKTREYQRLKNAESSVNTRKVSAKAGELHTKHMTERYRTLVDEELTELRFKRKRPTLAQKTNKARVEVTPLVSAELKNIAPERVFSEGERTSIALACFLAELRLGNDSTGLIFDDPVSSLDHNVREHVARRLVAAAKERQVIVFTHDLAFLADLRGQAKKIQDVECEFRTLFATDYHSGFVESDEPFGAQGVSKRTRALKVLVTDAERAAKDGDLTKLKTLTRTFYEDLRRTWERFVEERLFASVVSRLERNVIVGALAKVPFTKELGETVHEGWRRCSNAIEAHDHAMGAGTASHSLEDMKADLQKLVEAEKSCRTQ